ncbi:Tm-1-like ATP-binding domain-containing protein [Propionibacteriaceae bacterium G57]|uniref:Tm-1-like ATP-binding domain-containing protein n=1 Tax=Aestuariimicrobium sp. G57 TaxID=3418485 RepID=UPI003DA739DB
MATVALLGTLDTKGEECLWLRDRLRELGADTLIIDVGSFSHHKIADVTSDEVARAAGEDPEALREHHDRGEMMRIMGTGAAAVAKKLASEGRIHGLLSFGGSGGSSVAAPVMQALPVGFPKLLVSTMASGNVKPYVGEVDATLMYSVVDVAGMNSISSKVFGNAAAGIAGMATDYERRQAAPHDEGHKPNIGITMFGLTTPAADEARHTLEALGYEPLVFHATGTGGQAMEKLVHDGLLAGVCDLTTTELCDDLAGGILSAGPDRLEEAGKVGLPQVVSLGALDMVNFGPRDEVPAKYDGRNFLVHNPTITLMRTTPAEMAELGRRIARKLAAATGPTELFIPLRGISGIDIEGGPFWDPEANADMIAELKAGLEGSAVVVHELDQHINDPGFGRAMAEALHRLITSA